MPRTRRVDTSGPGIRRVERGIGFSYHEEDGERITDKATLERIRVACDPARLDGRLDLPAPPRARAGDRLRRRRAQAVPLPRRLAARAATGSSSRRWRTSPKSLPTLRERLDEDLAPRGLVFERVCSCAVRLLDCGLFRIGSERYETENESYGLTTIKRKHVKIERGMATFDYPSKSGQSAASTRSTTHR